MSSLTLALVGGPILNIDYKSERTNSPRYSPDLEYEDIYDWLISVRKPGSILVEFFILRCITVGWVEVKTSIIKEFLERNYL